jgi:polygalacturonase
MKTSLLILGSILVQFSVFGQQKVWDLGTLGAKGDGLSNNTTLIQGAIDQASAAGGGIVRIPAGRYLTSVLRLKSGVELHFDEGAVLLGSTLRSDYGGARASALLLADDQQNISLSGKGVIDGQGREVVKDVYRML